MIRLGVIGTGNIGKRHIQSALDIEDIEIFAFDSYKDSLVSLEAFLKTLNLNSEKKVVIKENYHTFLESISEDSIIIISTTAKDRVKLAIDILNKKPKAIILEKPVCQNAKEYLRLLKNSRTQMYVNFPRCSYNFYREIKDLVNQNVEEIKIVLSQNGISTNGIHMFDLIFWLLEKNEYVLGQSEIFSNYETKRKGFFDFSGSIDFRVGKTKCSFLDNPFNCQEIIQIFTRKNIISIYEHNLKAVVSSRDNLKVIDFKLPFQSNLTSILLQQIDNSIEVFIPDIRKCLTSHSLLFEVMDKHNLSNLNIT